MEQDSFIKSLTKIGAGTVINMLIGFLATSIISRIVDPDQFGQFSIFTMYTNLTLIVFCFGMDQALVRFYYNSDKLEYKRRLAKECVFMPLILTIACLLIVFFLIATGAFDFKFDVFCTLLLCINILFNVVFRFSSMFVRLNHNNSLYARLQVYQKATYFIFALILLKLFSLNGLISLSIATVAAITLSLVISLVYQRKYFPRKDTKIDSSEMKDMIKFGFPFIFSMGITSLFQSLDKLSLDYFRSDAEVGVYASAMMYVTLFNVVQTAFNTAWAPKASEHYTKHPDDKSIFIKAFNIITFVMFSIGILLILFKDVFALVLGPKYREAAGIMPFLIFSPIMYTISETTVCGINFKKKSLMHVWIALGACLMNFIGNTVLVPKIGCKGAAISTGISYILFFVLRSFFGSRYYKIGFKWWKIIIITLLTIGFAAYNTFYRFSIISVGFALICYTVILILYWDTMKTCIGIAKRLVMPMLNRRKQNAG